MNYDYGSVEEERSDGYDDEIEDIAQAELSALAQDEGINEVIGGIDGEENISADIMQAVDMDFDLD